MHQAVSCRPAHASAELHFLSPVSVSGSVMPVTSCAYAWQCSGKTAPLASKCLSCTLECNTCSWDQAYRAETMKSRSARIPSRGHTIQRSKRGTALHRTLPCIWFPVPPLGARSQAVAGHSSANWAKLGSNCQQRTRNRRDRDQRRGDDAAQGVAQRAERQRLGLAARNNEMPLPLYAEASDKCRLNLCCCAHTMGVRQ